MSTYRLQTTSGYGPTNAPSQDSNNRTLPPFVYRVQRSGAQTQYEWNQGFRAKNRTTIINFNSVLVRFGLAHLFQQTNISSPFISVYSDQKHAEEVARSFAEHYRNEEILLVTIDTSHLSRGPIFWVADILAGQQLTQEQMWLHQGEYLCLYKINTEALRDQTVVSRASQGYGPIGGGR